MENKTPLQIMADKIHSVIIMWKDPSNEMDGLHVLETLHREATELLPVEKEQIIDAVIFGNRQECYDGTETIGETYYNQTYKQQL